MWGSEIESTHEPEASGYTGQPVLVSGDGGDAVVDLCRLLAERGFATAVSRGEAGHILTNEVYAAVEAFRDAAGVKDELARDGAHVVGPATWAALV